MIELHDRGQRQIACPRINRVWRKAGLSQPTGEFTAEWAVQDSNLRPPACKAGALPAELTAPAATDGSSGRGYPRSAAPID